MYSLVFRFQVMLIGIADKPDNKTGADIPGILIIEGKKT